MQTGDVLRLLLLVGVLSPLVLVLVRLVNKTQRTSTSTSGDSTPTSSRSRSTSPVCNRSPTGSKRSQKLQYCLPPPPPLLVYQQQEQLAPPKQLQQKPQSQPRIVAGRSCIDHKREYMKCSLLDILRRSAEAYEIEMRKTI